MTMTLEGVAADLERLGFKGYASAIRAHLRQPAQPVDVAEAIRKGFMTAESCGPDNRYVLSIKFGSLDDLQAAHNALVGLTAALQEKGNG